MEIESELKDLDEAFWKSEFLKFKRNDKLYEVRESVLPASKQDSDQYYEYRIDWPYQAPPGSYQLDVFAVKDHRVLVVNESLYSRPGPQSAEAVEELARFLHPKAF